MFKNNKRGLIDVAIYLTVFIIILLTTLKLPFYIDIPGGVIDIGDRISIDKEIYSGSLNMTYVRSINATPITYLFANF